MPITAYAPREVLSLGEEAERLLESVMIQINNQLKGKGKVFPFGRSFISVDLAKKPPREYEKMSDEQKITFFLLLRSEYVREGWRDLNLHISDATGAKCFSVDLKI